MGSNGPLEVLFVAKSPQNIYSSLFLLKCQQKNHTHTECRPHPGTASYLGRWSSPPLLLPQLCSRNIESLEQEYEKKEPTVCRQPALDRCLVLTIFFDPQRPAQSLLWPSPPLPLSLFPIFLGVFSFYTSAPVWLMFCSEMWRWWKTDWFKVSFSSPPPWFISPPFKFMGCIQSYLRPALDTRSTSTHSTGCCS